MNQIQAELYLIVYKVSFCYFCSTSTLYCSFSPTFLHCVTFYKLFNPSKPQSLICQIGIQIITTFSTLFIGWILCNTTNGWKDRYCSKKGSNLNYKTIVNRCFTLGKLFNFFGPLFPHIKIAIIIVPNSQHFNN